MPDITRQAGERRALARWDNEGGAREHEAEPPEPVIELAKRLGELMRYLAELPWAPDAILLNRSLMWSVENERTFWVAAGSGAGRGSVQLGLDDDGRIGSVFARDRPYTDGKLIDERPWSGRFSSYPLHAGRWIPFTAEVGWAVDGQVSNYWRGSLLGWEVA